MEKPAYSKERMEQPCLFEGTNGTVLFIQMSKWNSPAYSKEQMEQPCLFKGANETWLL